MRPSLAWMALTLCAVACNPEVPTETPDGVWRAFHKALDRRRPGSAFDLISAADQGALAARAKAAGGSVKAQDMLIVDRRSLPPWQEVEAEVTGDRAVIRIALEGGVTARREAVREGGAWRVVLGVTPP